MTKDEIVDSLIPLIEEFKRDPNLELEGILGVFGSNKFVTGVDFNYFKALYGSCSPEGKDFNIWSKPEEKLHFASYYYKDSVRGRYNVKDRPVFVRKVSKNRLNLNCKQRLYDIRINLKEEKPLQNYCAKDIPEYVRLHERWSFIYKDVWRYDFSKVSSGATKELACASQPVFEVELEILRNHNYLNNISNRDLAINLVEKLTDLLGRFDIDHNSLALSLDILV
jgi:hypothetical protein